MLICLRISVGYNSSFQGNVFSVVLFIGIFLGLLYFFFTGRNNHFIILWLSFYFASPIIVLPFTAIGSLGLMNAIFIPLMIFKVFDLKNKYFIMISLIFLLCIINLSDVVIRVLVSRIFSFAAPFVFLYFAFKKCKNPELIIWSSIIIALINIPLGIYEIIVHPAWGGVADWRGFRIFGNLFWHNSYSFYLLPCIVSLYAFYRRNKKTLFLALALFLVIMDIFTFSRNGLLSLIISLVVFESLYLTGFKITNKKIVTMSLLILGILLYIVALPTLNIHLTPDTVVERTAIWDTITPYIKSSMIFGNGLGSYELFRGNFLNELSSHNYYLNVIFELGLVGLALFLIFIFFIFKDLKSQLNSKQPFRYAELGIALIVGILVYSFVGNGAFSQVVSLNTWIILGLCVKHHEQNK
jgi:O-antigen ligase